jgi:hypothetical protein
MLAWLPLAVAATVLRADPAGDAFAAAMSLSTQANYTWTAQISRNGRTTAINGQAMPGSYALATFGAAPPKTGASPTSSASAPVTGGKKAVYLGDKYVVEAPQGGWGAPVDAPAARDDSDSSARNNGNRSGARGGGGGGMRGARGGSRGGVGGGGSRGGSGSSSSGRGSDTGSANAGAPGAINLPHEELSLIATNYTELHPEDGGVSGKLSSTGADLLFMPPGSSQRPPEGAAGTFRLWIKDGAITKYELKLTASTAPGGRGGSYTETRTVEISGIGSTKVEIPEAAKRRLGA